MISYVFSHELLRNLRSNISNTRMSDCLIKRLKALVILREIQSKSIGEGVGMGNLVSNKTAS